MKRMNVREFRKNVSNLGDEPIEVVRYSETIGFWTPIALTTEPKVTKKIKTWSGVTTAKGVPTTVEISDLMERIKKFNDVMDKIDAKSKS